jgi:hypothetical protein
LPTPLLALFKTTLRRLEGGPSTVGIVRTFILRLQDERGDRVMASRLRGVVDEVATGSRVTFRSADELVRALLREPHGDTDHTEKEI